MVLLWLNGRDVRGLVGRYWKKKRTLKKGVALYGSLYFSDYRVIFRVRPAVLCKTSSERSKLAGIIAGR
jgi:hypothetical protein